MSYGTATGMANGLTRRSLLISGSHDCVLTCSPTKLARSWKVENYRKKKKKENEWIPDKNQLKLEALQGPRVGSGKIPSVCLTDM